MQRRVFILVLLPCSRSQRASYHHIVRRVFSCYFSGVSIAEYGVMGEVVRVVADSSNGFTLVGSVDSILGFVSTWKWHGIVALASSLQSKKYWYVFYDRVLSQAENQPMIPPILPLSARTPCSTTLSNNSEHSIVLVLAADLFLDYLSPYIIRGLFIMYHHPSVPSTNA